ncbi:hypothetical protein P3339_12100 [Microbulbifer sp. MLAF003]|uniref:hypothetical protein n=1 Tax=unclassified Microbulbifer TaxID=2619833 RepID=UPI0024AD78F8|nr:hypothetical protein [Microbulbifer sp. MLAF003]WHI49231.1 hypothetical protein P3339_12100 [Microbulbifer sp. MLAF003]
MNKDITFPMAIGLLALLVGVVTFMYNWLIVGGGWEYFGVFLFPGNLILSLFTEEIDFWPKFALQMSGQFSVIFSVAYLARRALKEVVS